MKNIYITVLFLLSFFQNFATTYYLSNSGSDANSGISSAQPWQTIDQLNLVLLLPGDSVLFEAGSIFRGEIVINSSGTEDNKIYFGKYGSGNLPVISGAEEVSGWSLYSGNIYKATLIETPVQVLANGKLVLIARYPNSGFLYHQNGIGNIGFIDSSLTQSNGFWNNANVRMRMSDRIWEINKVSSYMNDSLLFPTSTNLDILSGFGYYLDNLLPLIDTANELFYDSTNQVLYLNAPGNADPTSLMVEATIYDYGFLIKNGSSHLVIENLQLEQQKSAAIFFETFSTDIKISASTILNENENGIRIPGGLSNSSILGNTFSHVNGISISALSLTNTSITNNSIKNNGLVAGYGFIVPTDIMMAMELSACDSIVISENNLDSIGSVGILAGLTNSIVEKNILNHCLLNSNDYGGLHCISGSNNLFSDNFILNTIGSIGAMPLYNSINVAGIYFESANNNVIQHNTVAFSKLGMLLNNGSANNTINSNVVYGCSSSQLKLMEGSIEGSTIGNKLFGNTLYSLHEIADVVLLESDFNNFNPITSDSNYYFNPYNDYIFHVPEIWNGITYQTYSDLNQWWLKTLNDAHSKSSFTRWHRFNPIDTLGNSLISNGTFTNNFDGWNISTEDNVEMLLDNGTPLDGGCIKIIKNSGDFFDGGINTKPISIDSGKFYLFSFSNYSILDGFVRLQLSMIDSPFLALGLDQYFHFNYQRSNEWEIFQGVRNNENSRLDVTINYFDSIVWADNINLIPVSAFYETPEKKSRLFINTTGQQLNFSLGDSIFFDLDQNLVSNELTLNSYSSTILLYDSSLINNIKNISLSENIVVYPNPAKAGATIFIKTDFKNPTKNFIQLFSISGKLLWQVALSSIKYNEINLPSDLSAGIYLIKLNTANKSSVTKLVITN